MTRTHASNGERIHCCREMNDGLVFVNAKEEQALTPKKNTQKIALKVLYLNNPTSRISYVCLKYESLYKSILMN